MSTALQGPSDERQQPDDSRRPLRFLALDGGGVRGVSELIILQQLMLYIQKEENLPQPPKPCEIFDLIGGTSTGGLIAIMLGRLKMSVEQAIDEYRDLAKGVFSSRKSGIKEGIYYATKLEKAIQDVVEQYGTPKLDTGNADPNLKLLEPESNGRTCKVFVCSRNARAMDSVRLFRSYRSFTVGEYENVTIWQAGRATSAAPTFFKRARIGPGGMEEEFLDGGLGSNNPADILITEAIKIFGPRRPVSCILSIGTGKADVTEFKSPGFFQRAIPTALIDALKDMTLDCERVAQRLDERFTERPGIYFRFNVEQGLQNIGLEEWKELGNIKAKTIQYLQDSNSEQRVKAAAHALYDINVTSDESSEPQQLLVADLGPLPRINHRSLIVSRTIPVTESPVISVPFSDRIQYFVGRKLIFEKLEQLFYGSNRDTSKSSVVVLHAMGGQGKTQIALEFCYRVNSSTYDYILWADATNASTLDRSLSQFMGMVRATQALGSDTREAASTVASVKRTLQGRQYLLVIDNLDDPKHFGHVKELSTIPGKGDVLITSRHMDTIQLGLGLPLDEMSPDDAVELLMQRAGTETNQEQKSDALELVNSLGRLALGVDQAAAFIRETKLSYRQFMQKFRTARDILLDEDLPEFWDYKKAIQDGSAEFQMYQRVGVWTTWNMSYDLLKSQTNGLAKCNLLILSAFLNSRNISQAGFGAWLEYTKAVQNDSPPNITYGWCTTYWLTRDFTEDTAMSFATWAQPLLDDLDQDSNTFLRFIRDAHKLSLVYSMSYNDDRGLCFSIHPLIRSWLRRRKESIQFIHDAIGLTLILLFKLGSNDIETPELRFECIGHVLACIESNSVLPEDGKLGMGRLREAGLEMCYQTRLADFQAEKEDILINALHELDQEHGQFSASIPPWLPRNKLERHEQAGNKRVVLLSLGGIQLRKGDSQAAEDYFNRAASLITHFDDAAAVETISSLLELYVENVDEQSISLIFQRILSPLIETVEDGEEAAMLWIEFLHNILSVFTRKDRTKLCVQPLRDLLSHINAIRNTGSDQAVEFVQLSGEYFMGYIYACEGDLPKAEEHTTTALLRLGSAQANGSTLFLTVGSLVQLIHLYRLQQRESDEKDARLAATQAFSDDGRFAECSRATNQNLQGCFAALGNENAFRAHNIIYSCLVKSRPDQTFRIEDVSEATSHLSHALYTGSITPEMLEKMENILRHDVRVFGRYDEWALHLLFLLATGHFMIHQFEKSQNIYNELVELAISKGRIPNPVHVRSVARCMMWCGKDEDFAAYRRRFPDIDWAALQDEEINRMNQECGSSVAPASKSTTTARKHKLSSAFKGIIGRSRQPEEIVSL